MVKTWTFLGFLAAIALLPAGAGAQVDTTPPVITVHVAGALGLNGWRVGNTTVGWTYYDNESGIIWSSPSCNTDTVVVETMERIFRCTARNGAGDEATGEYRVKLDKTPPTVAAQPSRPADANGWFNHGVGFTAQAQDAFSGVDRCDLPSYDGPDSAHATVTVPCFDRAGHRGTATPGFMYDDTAPTVRAVLARRPDRYGWYAKDVRVSFTGSDATSHIDGCSSSVYRGPDTARASVTGWCLDRAGNQSSITHSFKFSKPLLEPFGRRVASPPLLDWVDVRRAREYNLQVWHDGRKILSKWPDASRWQLGRRWKYQGETHVLKRGESYRVYVWPRFRNGYGELLARGGFRFVRG